MTLHNPYTRTAAAFFLTLALTACSMGQTHDIKSVTVPAPSSTAPPSISGDGAQPQDSTQTAESQSTAPPTQDVVETSITGRYFKAGDFRYQLNISNGNWENRDSLSLIFSTRDPADLERSRSQTVLSEYLLPCSAKTGSYQTENILEANVSEDTKLEADITLNGDGTVSLSDGTAASGEYYPYVGHLFMPDAFLRPLCSADLTGLTKNDMRLIRNEFYAVYGRVFSSEDLSAYFEGRPWYRGTTASDQFSEEILGGLYKRNITFLKTAEDAYDETLAESAKASWEDLSPAPYLDLLPKSGETLVTIPSGPENAVDQGIYYVAQGTISVPVTLTPDQIERLEAGETVTLEINGLTGETETLKKSLSPSYGTYVFGDEAGGNYVMASYHPETGLFTLWHDSDDTNFKPVYEGELYILKGAMEEYYGYFDLPPTKQDRPGGGYRYIDFEIPDPDGYSPYSGNILVHDSKGYIKALYFMGD